jgi:hypothetical protein
VRDGMDDISVRTIGRAAGIGKECGNGAMIEHNDSWSPQYCHMAKGSLRVKVGDRVVAGLPIGLVGLSGDTEFPHLHFTVRHARAIVDPFAYEAPPNSCGGGHSIWIAAIHEQAKYRPREILNAGFSGVAATMDLLESGEVLKHPAAPDSEALVAYVRASAYRRAINKFLQFKIRPAQLYPNTTRLRSKATRLSTSFPPDGNAESQPGPKELTRQPTA